MRRLLRQTLRCGGPAVWLAGDVDVFDLTARHIAPNRDYTVFLLEQAGAPLGAAEYIGDLISNDEGNGHSEFHLIVQEAFSSTLVNGNRVRVDLNRVGMWFADPKDDDFCVGPNIPVTPFDGDNEAGVQAFNSANADPAARAVTRRLPSVATESVADAAGSACLCVDKVSTQPSKRPTCRSR